jgi:hypothetical protein
VNDFLGRLAALTREEAQAIQPRPLSLYALSEPATPVDWAGEEATVLESPGEPVPRIGRRPGEVETSQPEHLVTSEDHPARRRAQPDLARGVAESSVVVEPPIPGSRPTSVGSRGEVPPVDSPKRPSSAQPLAREESRLIPRRRLVSEGAPRRGPAGEVDALPPDVLPETPSREQRATSYPRPPAITTPKANPLEAARQPPVRGVLKPPEMPTEVPAPARAAREEPAPSIRVTIGRIEVRAIMPAPPAASAPASPAPRLSLDEYLRRQSGGRG